MNNFNLKLSMFNFGNFVVLIRTRYFKSFRSYFMLEVTYYHIVNTSSVKDDIQASAFVKSFFDYVPDINKCTINTVGLCHVSSLTSVVITIEVDPRVPGNRGDFPSSQAKQCSPELDSPVFSPSVR